MRLRLRLTATVALSLAISACVTMGGVEQETAEFHSDDAFRAWFAFYYQEPHPEYVTSGLKFMAKSGYLVERPGTSDMPLIASVFLAKVFTVQTAKLASWSKSWQGLGAAEWYVILTALWLADTPESRGLARLNLEKVDPEHRARLTTMLATPPGAVDPLTAAVVSPRQIPLLWAAFSATGDERYVRRVVTLVRFYGEDPPGKSVIGEAAIVTLVNNALQHKLVAQICAEAAVKDSDPKTRKVMEAMQQAMAKGGGGALQIQPEENPTH